MTIGFRYLICSFLVFCNLWWKSNTSPLQNALMAGPLLDEFNKITNDLNSFTQYLTSSKARVGFPTYQKVFRKFATGFLNAGLMIALHNDTAPDFLPSPEVGVHFTEYHHRLITKLGLYLNDLGTLLGNDPEHNVLRNIQEVYKVMFTYAQTTSDAAKLGYRAYVVQIVESRRILGLALQHFGADILAERLLQKSEKANGLLEVEFKSNPEMIHKFCAGLSTLLLFCGEARAMYIALQNVDQVPGRLLAFSAMDNVYPEAEKWTNRMVAVGSKCDTLSSSTSRKWLTERKIKF